MIIKINIATTGKIIPFKACATNNTSNGSNPSEDVVIPIRIMTVKTILYFLLSMPPFHPNKLLIVAAAPVGEAMADESPAANKPMLIAKGQHRLKQV